MSNEIVSGNAAYLTFDFENKDREPTTPSAVYVTVLSKRPGSVVRAETPLSGPFTSNSVDVTITGDENTMVGTGTSEIRHVIVRATFMAYDPFITTYEYRVRTADS